MFSGYCHRCRNTLNGIKLALYLAKRANTQPPCTPWSEVEANYRAIENYFDQLHKIYQPIVLSAVKVDLGEWLAGREHEWQQTLARTGRTLVLDPPGEPVRGEFDPHHLGQAFDAFVASRARAGPHGGDARLAWGDDAGSFMLEWREEGRVAEAESINRTQPLHADTANSHESMALLLLKQVIAAHGGTCQCTKDEDFRVTLLWPMRQSATGNA